MRMENEPGVKKEKKPVNIKKEILSWLVTLGSAVVAALVIHAFLFVPVRVDGASMSDTLLDGGGIDYTEIGAIRWAFAIAPDHPLAFVPEPIAESQLRLYPNIMVEDTAHTINKKVGWLLHGQESILVPDFNTKCQCQILGEGIGFLPDYMVREAMAQSLLVTRQIHNPRQDSRMLLATQHSATGQVTQWIKKQFAPNGILTGIYQDLLHREN